MSIVSTIVIIVLTVAFYAATVIGMFAACLAREYVDDTPRDTPFRLATYDDVPEGFVNEVSFV